MDVRDPLYVYPDHDCWLHWDVTYRCNLECAYCFTLPHRKLLARLLRSHRINVPINIPVLKAVWHCFYRVYGGLAFAMVTMGFCYSRSAILRPQPINLHVGSGETNESPIRSDHKGWSGRSDLSALAHREKP